MLDRVPYEIFSKIIKFSHRHVSFITAVFDFEETSLPPFKATHVCRAWRTALLSDPTMWTCINLSLPGNPDEFKTLISRSRSAPLDVFIEQNCSSFDPYQFIDLISVFPHVFQEMYRFRKLQILFPAAFADVVLQLLKQPAPMLQTFFLELLGGEGNEREVVMLREAHKTMFLGNAPNLKHIYLQIPAGLDDLQLTPLNNLSTLRLRFASDTVIDGDILIRILQSSPRLRILDIVLSGSRPKITCSMPSNCRVPLPYLQELSLQGKCGVDFMDLFLGHLDIPIDSVKFDITCGDLHTKISKSAPLLYFLAQRHFSLLSIIDGVSEKMEIEFSEKVDLECSTSCMNSHGSSAFRILYDNHMPLDDLSDLLQKFKMSDITHMCLIDIPSESAMLRSIFVSLTNLQHLRVNHNEDPWDHPSKSYLKALIPRLLHSNTQTDTGSDSDWETETDDSTDFDANDDAGQVDLVPCPSLRKLELVFHCENLKLEEPYIQVLAECSETRKETGYSFKSITIYCKSLRSAKSTRALLRAYALERLVQIRIITSESIDY